MLFLVIVLAWLLIGVLAGTYVFIVDAIDGAIDDERPAVSLLLVCWAGLIAPFTLCLAVYTAWYITSPEHKRVRGKEGGEAG